jgi:beta-barrel assembly-enhancing protease
MRPFIAIIVLLSGIVSAQVRPPKPGFNLFKKEQDIQLGREAAAQVEKQYEVIRDPQLQQYIDTLGARLARSRYANDFPYSFKVVSDDSINAFALPGGPMFIQKGLIKEAESEAQLAGVMSHEMSHVALRHGTNQASKANLIQLPALLAGQVAGGSMLGSLAQAGVGLGANSALLKFSRTAESQADYNGALIMSDAGYNPLELAHFFEKLEAQSGSQGRASEFFSSHPNPGNRVQAIEALIRQLPPRQYIEGDVRGFQQAHAIVMKLPPAKPRTPVK